MPATITVTSLADAGPGTLRAAIVQANLDAAPDMVTFDPSAVGTISLASALPDLSTAIDIAGPGPSTLTVARGAAAPSFRIFTVSGGGVVTLSGLSVTGGHPSDPGTSPVTGGGIRNSATLTILDCRVIGNSVGGHYFTVVPSGAGGGISNSGTMSVVNSTVTANWAVGSGASGGGIFNSGTLSVVNSTVSGNFAVTETLFGNANATGGGISNSGTLSVVGSTVSGNSSVAGSSDGLPGQASGGGIFNSGTLSVVGSTMSGNSAPTTGRPPYSDREGRGGGIFSSGTLTVAMSIFANTAGGNLDLGPMPSGASVSGGHNLFTDSPGVALNPTDLINTDPLLGPLAANGGGTFTRALLPGSPAIDAGVAVPGVTADQRGVPRPQGSAPDIGAFESRGFTLSVTGGNDQHALAGSPFPAPLAVAVVSPFGEPVAGGRVTFAGPASGASAAFASDRVTLGPDGRADVTATANRVGGAYAVTVRAAGATGAELRLTNDGVPPVVNLPPTVVGLRRFGVHRRPTRLVLSFSVLLDPGTAQDVRNYAVVPAGPAGRTRAHARPIPVASAVHDPAAHAVTLTPRHRLDLHRFYRLTVRGTGPGAVAGADGAPLDGARTGRAGSDFVAVVHGFGTAANAATRALPAGPAWSARRPGLLPPSSPVRAAP